MPTMFRTQTRVTNLTSCAQLMTGKFVVPFYAARRRKIRRKIGRNDNSNNSIYDDGGRNGKISPTPMNLADNSLSRDVANCRVANDRTFPERSCKWHVYVAIHLCNECVVHFHGYPFSSRPCQISRANGPDVHARVHTRARVITKHISTICMPTYS